MSERDPNQTAVEDAALAATKPIHQRYHAYLVVIAGGKLGHRLLLGDRPCVLGRARTADLSTDEDSVSRHHARIEWAGGCHVVTDLGSTNGSFVNEQRITTRALVDGDRLAIGKLLLKYLKGGNVESEYHAELQRLMRFDGLTGAHNRRHFDEALQRVASDPSPSSLVLFDLDHFKAINDRHGHVSGDRVLRQVALRVTEELAPEQLLARIGGEEFAILCSNTALADAREIAERVRARVAELECVCDDRRVAVTISAGVAERRSGESTDDWMGRADSLLYASKRRGRNRVSV